MKQHLILDILDRSKSMLQLHNGYHHHDSNRSAIQTHTLSNRTQLAMKENADRMLDQHEIKHGLTDAQVRILLKIVAKEYDDCGRKRGAILRYIKHFEEVEAKTKEGDRSLFKKLRAIAEAM